MARILVIDDEEGIRENLQALLADEGHEVTLARNGKEGVMIYRKGKFDLVLTDVIMPGQEGIETIRIIRQADPEAKIIAMSGGGRIKAGDYLDIAKSLGAARVFRKPLDLNELFEAITEILNPPPAP
jgi:DNA-binding NtrC family response regulator